MAKGALLNVVAGLALCLQCSAQGGSSPSAPAPAPQAAPSPAHSGKGKHAPPNSHTTTKKVHHGRHHQPNVPFAPLVMQGQPDKELAFIMGAIGTIPYGHHVRYHLTEPKDIRTSGCGDLTGMFTPVPGENGLTLLLLDGDKDGCSMVRRAYNAGRAGAAGVLISRGNDAKGSKLEARIDASVDDLPSIEGIQIPVGTMRNDQAKLLREQFRKQVNKGHKHMWVEIDFKGLLPQTAKPAVWIWHDAADDCGSLCDANVDFLKQVAATQVKHGGKTKMVVRPRFIFQPCSEKGTEQQCAETCTDNQKYCHLKDIYVDKNGKAVAMEMVREACLWSTLTGGKPDSASPEWWKYKAQFLDECTSAKGTYTAECSERLAKGVTSGAQFEAWKKCYAPASTAGGTVKPADDEMAAMVDENEAWYDKLMVQINQKHYHGLFDTGHVYHAACVAMTQHKDDAICTTEAHGPCAPGRRDDLKCRNDLKHLTVCKKLPGDDKQGVCKCGPGWRHKGKHVPGKSDTECRDENECTRKTDPCNGSKGRDSSPRDVCHNLVGTFECLHVAQPCTASADFGGCWREFTGDVTIHACEDNIAAVREAAGKDEAVPTNQLPAYSFCDCSQVPGCYKFGPGNAPSRPCVKACPDEQCSAETVSEQGTCSADGSKRTAGIAGGIAAAAVVLLAAALAALLVRRRRVRSRDNAELRKQASAYAAWQDGLSGDEMQRSATVASSGAEAGGGGGEGAFRAASAAAYVSTTGEEVLPDA